MLRPVTALDFFLNFILITTLRVTFHLQKLQSIHYIPCVVWASQVVLEVKNPPANAGDMSHGFDPRFSKIPWRRQ